MLYISSDLLPNDPLTYLAFRVSFLETLERIVLARQVNEEAEGFGYLTEVPFLCHVPAHVQLDLLAETWSRHTARKRWDGTLVDESVVYAVCETAAYVAETDPSLVKRCLSCGPNPACLGVDRLLPDELRNLHLSLSNEGDFLLISQFEDMEPDESRDLKRQFRLSEERLKPMFEVLGRWGISREFARRLDGLLSEREIARASAILGLQPIQS